MYVASAETEEDHLICLKTVVMANDEEDHHYVVVRCQKERSHTGSHKAYHEGADGTGLHLTWEL